MRSQTDFASICVNTKKFGLNSLRYFASKVWSMVPLEIEKFWKCRNIQDKNSKLGA